MQTKSLGILLLVCLISDIAVGQDSDSLSTKRRLKYTNAFHFGGLSGNDGQGTSFSFATHHGVRMHRLAFTLGMGFDGYRDWRVVPFTGQLSYDFARAKNTSFYIAFTGGYSKAAEHGTWTDNIGGASLDMKGGPVIHPLAGVRVNTGVWSIYFSAGYKWQRIEYSYTGYYYDTPPVYLVEENLKRFQFSIGVGIH